MKLTELFKSIADTIRNCNPQAEPKIKAIDFPEAIVRACEESEVTGYNIGLTEGKESMIDRSKVIEKTANGNPVVINDASEIPHTVGVKVTNTKNIYEPSVDSQTSNGITVARNADNSYTVSGTATNDAYFHLGAISVTPNTKYYVSGGTADAKLAYQLRQGSTSFITVKSSGDVMEIADNFNNHTLDNINVVITVKSGTTVNCIVKPMISLDNTADYVPYNSPAVGASVRLSENGTTYTTDENGGFECESISPNMTFTCDDVVDIEVDYWKSWGMQTEYNRFWNCITKNNTRTDYQRAFYNWTDEHIRPPFVIKPINIQYTFFDMSNLKKIEKQYFDFSAVTAADGGFRNNPSLTIIEDCGLPAINQSGLFISDTKLETIELIRVNKNCTFSSANWSGCKALKNIVFEGVIGQSINFQYSPLLTTKSLLSILKALSKDSTYANGKTVTFNTASKAVIEADTACSEQLASAVSAGWTVAYA